MMINKKEIIKKIYKNYYILIMFITSFVIYFLMETISRHSIVKTFLFLNNNFFVFLYNTFIIFIPFTLVKLFKNKWFYYFMISIFWISVGLINGIILYKRVTPFNFQDLKVLNDALSLIKNYYSLKDLVMLITAILLIVFLIIYLYKKTKRYISKRNLISPFIWFFVSIFSLIVITNFSVEKNILSRYFGNIASAYENYGFPYSFICSMKRGMNKSKQYNENNIKLIKKKLHLELCENNSNNPNIIFVQLESFIDPSLIEHLELNKNPVPNFTKLKKSFSNGYLKVPVIGAGTSNTEFEVLTGMNVRFFGTGEYPYKTYLKTHKIESIASNLYKLGYESYAIHNNGGCFYSRNKVFNNIGFNYFQSKEFMNIKNYTENGWAKDDCLIKSINDALTFNDKPKFLYVITVQSHGEYRNSKVENLKIKIKNIKNTDKLNAYEYFLNQIKDVDTFIGKLISLVKKLNKKTIIVFFGDHIPTLWFNVDDLKYRYLYATEYVIWDNLGLKKQNKTLTSYELAAEILNRLGIHVGTMFNYHQKMVGNSNYQQYLELIQYDILYGKRYFYNRKKPKIKTKMIMGLFPPNINNIKTFNKYDKYIINGNNFNQSSNIFINGKKVKHIFINENMILLDKNDYLIKNNDKIVVKQIGFNNSIFKSSIPFTYVKK